MPRRARGASTSSAEPRPFCSAGATPTVDVDLIEPALLLRMFDSIVPGLERYPALDADLFASRVRETVSEMERAPRGLGGKP